jgi:hypothetical protein
MKPLLSLALAGTVLGQKPKQSGGGSSKSGIGALMGEEQTGIFGAGGASAGSSPSLSLSSLTGMAESVMGMTRDTTGGSGPYKASIKAVPGLAKHTLYMPKSAPADIKLPVIVWGNGACSGNGVWFSKFLVEISSHGFLIIANGAPGGSWSDQSKAHDIPDAIDWVYKNAGTGEYANVDKTRLAAAGQSCGGIQVIFDRHKTRTTLTILFRHTRQV